MKEELDQTKEEANIFERYNVNQGFPTFL